MQRGSAIIMLLMGIVMIAVLATMTRSMYTANPGGTAINALEKTYVATCAANRAAIMGALQMYALQHEPMKTLNLEQLFAPGSPPKVPKGASCTYVLDPAGMVKCKVHGGP